MHILLTDILTCPRCGPGFGLIVLAEEMRERHVREGSLGCANCRDRYPIRGGVVDFRGGATGAPARAEAGPPVAGGDPGNDETVGDVAEAAYRVAALLGLGDEPSAALLAGHPAGVVAAVARLLPDSRIVGVATEDADLPEGPSWIVRRPGAGLPFRDGSLRGVAIADPEAGPLVREGTRVLAGGGRIVLDPAPDGSPDRLRADGLEVLLEQDGVVVASLSRGR
jgi:uncharacterized protein YbaR (Trm112 family)